MSSPPSSSQSSSEPKKRSVPDASKDEESALKKSKYDAAPAAPTANEAVNISREEFLDILLAHDTTVDYIEQKSDATDEEMPGLEEKDASPEHDVPQAEVVHQHCQASTLPSTFTFVPLAVKLSAAEMMHLDLLTLTETTHPRAYSDSARSDLRTHLISHEGIVNVLVDIILEYTYHPLFSVWEEIEVISKQKDATKHKEHRKMLEQYVILDCIDSLAVSPARIAELELKYRLGLNAPDFSFHSDLKLLWSIRDGFDWIFDGDPNEFDYHSSQQRLLDTCIWPSIESLEKDLEHKMKRKQEAHVLLEKSLASSSSSFSSVFLPESCPSDVNLSLSTWRSKLEEWHYQLNLSDGFVFIEYRDDRMYIYGRPPGNEWPQPRTTQPWWEWSCGIAPNDQCVVLFHSLEHMLRCLYADLVRLFITRPLVLVTKYEQQEVNEVYSDRRLDPACRISRISLQSSAYVDSLTRSKVQDLALSSILTDTIPRSPSHELIRGPLSPGQVDSLTSRLLVDQKLLRTYALHHRIADWSDVYPRSFSGFFPENRI